MTAYSIKDSLTQIKLPIIPIMIGNFSLSLIIDTGSTHSLIDSGVAQRLIDRGLTEHSVGKVSIMGIDGKAESISGIKLAFYFQKQPYIQNFISKPLYDALISFEHEKGLYLHGILGTDFLTKHKWVIDFDKFEINT